MEKKIELDFNDLDNSIQIEMGIKYTLKIKRPPEQLTRFYSVMLQSYVGNPIPGVRCRLEFSDGKSFDTRADGAGIIYFHSEKDVTSINVTVLDN